MAQDTKFLSNRDDIVRSLRTLSHHLSKLDGSLEDAHKVLASARKKLEELTGLAQQGPQYGYRPMPKRIRTILKRLSQQIEKAAEEVRLVPVTRDERLAAKEKKAKRLIRAA